MIRLILLAVASAALVACSNAKGISDSAGETSPTTDSGRVTDDSMSSDTGDLEPVWIGVDGALTLSAGVPVEASFDFALYVDPTEEPVCLSTRTVDLGAIVAEASPDPSIYHWWRFSLEISDQEDACAAPLPQSLLFGLGALHPEILPALPEHALDGVSDSLYGAYANLDEAGTDSATAFAFGFAGTTEDRSGASIAVSGAPMPDGSYSVTGFYLFAVPD